MSALILAISGEPKAYVRRPGNGKRERDPRVAVVHGCHSKGGDSILSAFSWEPLRVWLQDNQILSLAS